MRFARSLCASKKSKIAVWLGVGSSLTGAGSGGDGGCSVGAVGSVAEGSAVGVLSKFCKIWNKPKSSIQKNLLFKKIIEKTGRFCLL